MMRLINTKTHQLQEFNGENAPPYAILSHTWESDEITFQDWLYATRRVPRRLGWVYIDEEIDQIRAKPGYTKIENACRHALAGGHSWLWADTVCIDKTNLVELSEAINSMFSWYRNSQICYVLLVDVFSASPKDCEKAGSEFRRSKWFTRGWTLQELLAPSKLEFVSRDWELIGDKIGLRQTISEVTTIPVRALSSVKVVDGGWTSIAEIMSWAAGRQTTRPEDVAYCLMGLFDINMPPLYGEGSKAFYRLQLEIIKKTSDISFLAWQFIVPYREREPQFLTEGWRFVPLDALARSPKDFHFSRDIHMTVMETLYEEPRDMWRVGLLRRLDVSNIGLTLSLPLIETMSPYIKFAAPGITQSGRDLWIPLLSLKGVYTRFNFLAATCSVAQHVGTTREVDVTLALHDAGSRQHFQLPRHYKWPVMVDTRSYVNVLLAFPAGFNGYRMVQQFPKTLKTTMNFNQDLILCLRADRSHSSIVYGAVEFAQTGGEDLDTALDSSETPSTASCNRVSIFFAVEMESNSWSVATRWTCCDISAAGSNSQYPEALTRRAEEKHSKLVAETSQDQDDTSWDRGRTLTGGNPTISPGLVLMDSKTWEIPCAPYMIPASPEATLLPKVTYPYSLSYSVILTQVIFPGSPSFSMADRSKLRVPDFVR